MDIIELDAASNRGIDEIREIRDKVNFAPVEGKRKVYIIDEAHMLTDQASNAFLKTLEEPPAHVIFILCTTEANKILPTIISRCQRHDFRRLPAETIYRRLAEISQGEAVHAELEALRLVARYAAGSLRDAENLLEQLVVSYGEGVSLQQVEELLGLGHGDRWLELTKYLLMGNTSAALRIVNQAAWDGTDLRQLHRQTLELLRAAMVLEWGSSDSLDLPDHVTTQIRELVSQLPSWRIVRATKIWGELDMRYDGPSTLPLELAAVEICNDAVAPPSNRETRPASLPAPSASAPERRPSPAEQWRPAPVKPTSNPAPPPGTSPVAGGAPMEQEMAGDLRSRWMAAVKVLARCRGKKYNLGALLRDCKADTILLEGDTLILPFTHRTNMERMQEEMADPGGRRMVTEAVEKSFGQAYTFKLILTGDNGDASNPRSAQQSSLVRTALGMGARIVEEYSE
jgi:DNA polymerase-3 subunit gamma/tau